jgi:hypothetical protein
MARFREVFRFRYLLSGIGIAALAAYAIRAFSDLPFWACFAIAIFGLLLNGWLATWEDEQSGGFNNPTDKGPSKRDPTDQT